MTKQEKFKYLLCAIIIYLELIIIINKAYEIDRYNEIHGIRYEHKTLGDVGEDILREHTSWGNDFFDSIDSWVEEHAIDWGNKGGN